MTGDTSDPRFTAALAHLLRHEGGFVDHKSDPGGATNYGISVRWLRDEARRDGDGNGWPDGDIDKDGDIDPADVMRLTKAQAGRLYYDYWWTRGLGGGSTSFSGFPKPVGEKLFDCAVNMGRSRATILLQRALASLGARVSVDGIVGPATYGAMKAAASSPAKALALTRAIAAQQRAFYHSLVSRKPKMRVFLRGWLMRADYLAD